MIPKASGRELGKLVRDRDRWKRKALDRAPVRSADRKREIAARDKAVDRLLYAVDVEGLLSHAARGVRGAVWEAIEALRPDIAETMKDTGLEDGACEARERFFPDPNE